MTEKSNEQLEQRFLRTFDRLEQAPSFAKVQYQGDVYQVVLRLMNTDEGIAFLARHAGRFQQAGLFVEGPWADPSKLQPALVAGSLQAGGVSAAVEVLNELRMLALAKGKEEGEGVLSPDDAKKYLNEVMASNLHFLFPKETESERIDGSGKLSCAEKLFHYLLQEISVTQFSHALVRELDLLLAQRPILIKRILTMIEKSKSLITQEMEKKDRQALTFYIEAVDGPSPMSKRYPKLADYRKELKRASWKVMKKEAETFARVMRATGLVSRHHALFVRHCNRYEWDLLPLALQLSDKGRANLDEHFDLIHRLIKVAIHPSTHQAVYGLACLLDRGVLSSAPVIPGLNRLIELDIHAEVKAALMKPYEKEGLTPNDVLLGGVITVLGQPLGVGQGLNPTCQSARGISLWAQHAPGYLLDLIARAARDNDIDMTFEGLTIHSQRLPGGLAPSLHEDLDAVSLVLVPHLDRIYNDMMKRVALRGDDGHKWVNPAFYGDWVGRGFANVIDQLGAVSDYAGFVRLFYATHHPDYNDDHHLIYPNPVGIFITNVHGKLLGFHAVSIQRIAHDEKERTRIYFYNPNNDSNQDWGQGIVPSVRNNGEQEGEASLPFYQFVSRLYAFHYNPYEKGDAYAVEDEVVQQVEDLSRASWGENYVWQ
ncbi:hypothetical protein [Mechercharimyces sp. CAU 1602]|uniref:hypothetical protein n=1 Tax=Mechercharimyces sp. CAU 1602 TaxID=2973933 RepID=UPI0037C5BA17